MREWIDTHLHLLYPERLRYDWAAGIPALNKAFHWADYWARAEPQGITQALHMEVDVPAEQIDAEIALIDELAACYPIAGMIAAARPESAEFAAWLDERAGHPRLRGLRRVLHTMPDALSQDELFVRNVQRLGEHKLTFDLCVQARQLPLARRLAQRCPEVQFVLDHCGVPDVAGQGLDPWRQHISELASLPNVACKISGVIAYGDPAHWLRGDINGVCRDLRPFVEHCIESFGWQRVVWGSDFPVCNLTRSLTDWMAVTQALLVACSNTELDALAHDNARRIYRLGA